MDMHVALISGIIAGLALAAPLGAIGVLLVQEGVTRGLRGGIASAAAVATVDVLYCTAAVTAGALAGPIVRGWSPWPQLVGGGVLCAMGLRSILKVGRASGHAVDQPVRRRRSALGRYTLFLGLTALNPATLVYFAAILTALGTITGSPATAIVFTAGVGVASFAWQALLVALGALLGRITGTSFQRWTAIIGNGLVIVLGALLIVHGLGSDW
ncbi:LysE family transporter [Plantibacter flavus]|uniref:LysE family transporter n=1 Tax=Plantibacter flavus TaxID=150123 RepID=UPI003F14F3A8